MRSSIGCGSMPSELAVNVPCTSSAVLLVTAGGEQARADRGRFDQLAGKALPRHADVLHAEIVAGPHVKHELLGVEHDAAAGQILAGKLRRFVVQRRDSDFERLLAGQAEFVLPFERNLTCIVDQQLGGSERCAGRLVLRIAGAGGA